jgi:hypothetical protein
MVRGASYLIEDVSNEKSAARCRLIPGCDYYTRPVTTRRVQLQLIRQDEQSVIIGVKSITLHMGAVDLITSISAYRMYNVKSGKFTRDCELAHVCEYKDVCFGVWIDCILLF